MVLHLDAVAYHRKMGSGRTRPALFQCSDADGNPAGEYVVKFRAGIESGVTGLMCELVASLLAQQLGLLAPQPAIVALDPTIAQLLPRGEHALAATIRQSGGTNFATKVIVGGYGTWPVDAPIPFSIRRQAAEVFAFDALTQNADRRFSNPNLLSLGDQIFVIDHDQAFSFLYALDAPSPPWNLEWLGFLEQHVFFRGLKGKPIDLDRFAQNLGALSDTKIASMEAEIPEEWKNENLPRVLSHVREVRDHVQEFIDQVARRLV